MKTTQDIPRYRAFAVKFHGPSHVKGSRLTITDTRHNKRRILPKDHSFRDVYEQAYHYLESIGIAICGSLVADVKPFGDQMLLTEDFETPLR